MKITEALSKELGQGFEEIRFGKGLFHRRSRLLTLTFLSGRYPTETQKKVVETKIRAVLPPVVRELRINYVNAKLDYDLLHDEVTDFFQKGYPQLVDKIGEENLAIAAAADDASIVISIDPLTAQIFEKQKIAAALSRRLRERFFGTVTVRVEKLDTQASTQAIGSSFLEKRKKLEMHFSNITEKDYEVSEITAFIGKAVNTRVDYICEIRSELSGVTVAGNIVSPEKLKSKSGKEYYKFLLKDITGTILCMYFPRSGVIEGSFEEYLHEGREVVVSGDAKQGRNGGTFNIMLRKISFCTLPQGLTYQKAYKPVKEEYEFASPKRLELVRQTNFLANLDERIPESLRGKRVVVFDLETTGLDPSCYGITEIGAVSIEDGNLAEYFSTFVNPEMPITLDITKITGIEDYMVKDAPTIDKVIGDFHKFCQGSVLVAHNIDFDIGFINRFAEENGYNFNDLQKEDTLAIARAKLKGLKNYKLNTVAEKLNVPLEGHHRAYNDALCTAKIYIELCKMQ